MVKNLLALAQRHLFLTTALFSLLSSIWLYLNHQIIARDSILYVKVSQAFLDGGIAAAFKVWSWPFYSVSFAFISKITGLSPEQAAYLLTIFLEMVISVQFVRIYSRIAFDGARFWVAMVFILSFITLNDYKGEIIREYGFWAFSLIALEQFILYYQYRHRFNALAWQVSIIAAALFRPEAAVFAVMAPFYFLLAGTAWRQKFKDLLALNSLFYSATLIALIAFLSSTQIEHMVLNNLPPQIDYFTLQKVFANFNQAVDNFILHVLPFHYSAKYSHLIIASGLLAMLLFKLVVDFGILYVGIWGYGKYHRWVNHRPEIGIIYFFMAIAVLILAVFITSRLFVSTRYTVFLLLLAGLVFCQYLDRLLDILSRLSSKFWLGVLLAYLVVQFLDGMISLKPAKLELKQAGEYLASSLSSQQRVACNESRLDYYSGYACDVIKTLKDQYSESDRQELYQNYDYLLVWVKHKNLVMLKSLRRDKNLHLERRFIGESGNVSLLYQIKPTASPKAPSQP